MPARPWLLSLLLLAQPALAAGPPKFDRIVIDDDFPGGYQVEVADVDGDKRPDIVAVGGTTLAWYENPSWKKRIITKGKLPSEIISSATADLDGDGKAEVAVACDFAMNDPRRGRLLLATQGETSDDPWTFRPIAGVPSIHRLRWGDLDGDGKPELVVAPIFGADSRPPSFDQGRPGLAYFRTGPDPKAGRWEPTVIGDERPVIHAIAVNEAGRGSVLTADNLGVALFEHAASRAPGRPLIPGAAGEAPKRGSSEVHLGKLADGRRCLATVDPWHGTQLAVRVAKRPDHVDEFGPRAVIDDTLDDGHALWVADVDGDGNDEIFAGHRGKDARVSVYRLDGETWARTVLDPKLTAQDLRGGDIDGDGTPDVVAIGGKSHNIVWFRPVR